MLRLSIIISIFPLCIFGQLNPLFTPAEQTKAYSRAIAEYINITTGNITFHFDTLYIGKHEEFPDIQLPSVIQNKRILLLGETQSAKGPQNNNNFVLVNIVELKSLKTGVEFMLVTFYKGYHPQHNCYINLNYDPAENDFTPYKKIRFEYPYPKH